MINLVAVHHLAKLQKDATVYRHNNCLPNSKKSRGNNLLKDKGKSLPRSIAKQLREKGLLSGNFICKTYPIFAKKFFGYSLKSKIVESNSDSSDDEIGNSELPETVEINLEIQRLAFKINFLRGKSKVNFRPIVDLLPLATVKNALQMKIEEIV